jgi:hypothetical protein
MSHEHVAGSAREKGVPARDGSSGCDVVDRRYKPRRWGVMHGKPFLLETDVRSERGVGGDGA